MVCVPCVRVVWCACLYDVSVCASCELGCCALETITILKVVHLGRCEKGIVRVLVFPCVIWNGNN